MERAHPGLKVTLVPGGRGVFDVFARGQCIFSKRELDRFPDEGELVQFIDAL
ncbi:MAG: Rdx family protein [Myxococcales bacterium]|nr:Rdx family protein [Myxococcales bacterium]